MTGNPEAPACAAAHPLLYHGAALLFTAGAVLIVYAWPLARGRAYISHDTADLNYVMLRSHVMDLRAHGFVAWLPAIGTGHYRAANPTYGIFSPRVSLFYLFSGYGAQLASILVYAVWAALGGYVLGWVLTRSRPAAVCLGLVWSLGGVTASQVMNVPYFTSGAWLPWALAAWIGTDRAGLRIALSAACSAMVAVEGDLPGAVVMLGVLGLLAVLDPSPQGRARDVLHWAAAAVLAVALSAAAWMPAWAMLPESRRAAGLAISEAMAFSLHPARLANLAAPDLWGWINGGSFWAPWLSNAVAGKNLWFHSVYLGLFTPLLILPALFVKKAGRKRAGIFMAVSALMLLLATGSHAGVMTWLMEHFPLLRAFRYPAKLFTFSALLLASTAAMGLARVESIMADARIRRRAALAAGLILLAALTMLVRYAAASADAVRATSPDPALSFLLIERDLARIVVAIIIIAAVAWTAGRGILSARLVPWIIAMFFALDLTSALPAYQMAERGALDRPSTLAGEVRGLGPGRLVVSDNLYYFVKTTARDALLPDWGVLDGVDYAFGKTASLPARVSSLFTRERLTADGAAIFRVLGVRTVLATADPPEKWAGALAAAGVIREVKRDAAKNIVLYEAAADNPQMLVASSVRTAPDRDRALTLALTDGTDKAPVLALDSAVRAGALVRPAPSLPEADTGGTGRVLAVKRTDGDHERIEAESDGAAWLIAREYLMPGWHATVDSREADIYFADGIGRAVFLPRGRHEVMFTFRPAELAQGAWTSLAALAAVILIMAHGFYRRRRANHGRP